jgi:hypothetical protein
MKIDITDNEMAQRLKSLFKEEYQDDIVDVLLGALEGNEHALSILFKRSLGIIPVLNYKVKDEILVRGYDLDSWRFDREKTEESEYASKGYIICKITDVNKYAFKQYGVTFTAIDEHGKRIVLKNNVNESCIQGIYEGL